MNDIARRYSTSTTADMAAPIVFREAHGCTITDDTGKQYLDFITGYGVCATGWQHPEVLEAMRKQLEKGCFSQPWLPTVEATELAEFLLKLAPSHFKAVSRATSGAEANEIALRAHLIARGGKVLVIGRSYHGGTSRALSSSDRAAFRLPLSMHPDPPRVPPAFCSRCPWGKTYPDCSTECVTEIDETIDKDPEIKGIFLELMIGSGGAVVPPPRYFEALHELIERRKLSLIVDEVMTGCGRTGTFLFTSQTPLKPNAITLGKGFGGGYVPIAAALMDAEFAQALRKFEDVSPTMSWTPLACTAALSNLRLIVELKLAENAAQLGPILQNTIRRLFEEILPGYTGEVRGRGLLIGVDIVHNSPLREPHSRMAKRVLLQCLREGLMIGASWDWHTLLFIPPLVVDQVTINLACDRLKSALLKCA